MKYKNKIINWLIAVLIIISIFTLLSLQTLAVDITPSKIDKTVTFDEPKAAKTHYTIKAGVRFKNTDNSTSDTFTPPTWTPGSGWDPKIGVEISCPEDKNLDPLEQSRCDVIFKVANTISVDENIYEKKYTGTINAGGGIPVTLTVKWLPPQLTVVPPSTFGKLTSGKTESGKITIKELRGYKAAHGINFEIDEKEINASGVKASLPESYIGKLDAGGLKDLSMNIEVPQRGLVPGNYTGKIIIKYKEEYLEDAYSIPPPLFKFEIPYPKIGLSGLSNKTIDFPDLDIPYQGSKEFTLNEIDGYTGIEGIKFNITKAYNIYEGNEEEYQNGISWVTFDDVDFVSAGGAKKVKVHVNVPKSAAIGKYRWEGIITTAYAGSSDIFIGGTAALPGCPDMIDKLKNMASLPLVKKNTNAESLRKDTLALLDKSGCVEGLSEVLTVAAASETLLTAMNDVKLKYDKGEIDHAYQQLKNSRTEVDTLDGTSTTYLEYMDNVDNIKNLAKGLWKDYADSIIEKLVKEAEESRYTNPKLCSDNYNKISILYTKMGDTQKALSYSDKATECQKGHTDAGDKAKEAEAEAKKIYEEADTKIFTKSDYKVVILIFNYPEVDRQYNQSILKFNESLGLYEIVNKPRDVTRIKEQIDKLKKEKETLKKAAIAYVIIIVLIILFSFISFLRASANYNRDTLEADLSKVVTRQNVK